MPDIGASLREARMRARIDISEIESQTKIRAKYLRALENEEWDLLPGPTYIKSFLRTYAETLDLDAKLLVDEYKLRHERLSEVELQPINAAAPGRERRRQAPLVPRWLVLVLIFVALIVTLSLLGGNDKKPPPAASPPPSPTTSTTPRSASKPPPPAVARPVRLRIIATSQVYVCLKAGGKTLIDGRSLTPGERTPAFTSKRFRLTLGNNGVRLFVNGREKSIAPSAKPINMQITPRGGRQPLPQSQRPVCNP
jgi:cytoskeleton protein RodZ